MGESKIEDFSEPITPVNGAKIAVFWDVEDCPFPVGSNPDMIYHKIESAFRKRDLRGKVSIWAYVDENNGSWEGEFLREKTWEARIYFLPGGDKLSKRHRMLNDILLWVMDSPVDHPEPATLIVVSDKVRYDTQFFGMLRNLIYRNYGVFLVTPTQHVRPGSSEWPGLLFDDDVYCFFCESQSSEPSHKKHKADAAEETPEGSEDQG